MTPENAEVKVPQENAEVKVPPENAKVKMLLQQLARRPVVGSRCV